MEGKIQIDIYKGLPIILEKVKAVALASVIGKQSYWINHKLDRYVINGTERHFLEADITLINNALSLLGEEITQHLIEFAEDRAEVISQVRELSKCVSMPYVCEKIMGKPKRWYEVRMYKGTPGGRVTSFKEDDILQLNMATMQIANELKSIEFILK